MLTNFEIDKLAEALKKKMGEKDELLNIKQIAESWASPKTPSVPGAAVGRFPTTRSTGTCTSPRTR